MEMRERRTETVTLKQKLKMHYENRPDFTAKEKDVNLMGVWFFWGMTFTLLIESQAILIPALYAGDWTMICLSILLVWFTLFEVVINWMGVYFGSVNYADDTLKKKHFPNMDDTPEEWTHCPKCQIDAPPRSFHCRLCNACVLKRDHHCYFTNSCVGFYNQRFFVLFCIYMIWGNLFALYLQLNYLNKEFPLNSWHIFSYFPMVALFQFLFRYVTFIQCIILIHASLCFVCLLGAIFFTGFQFLLISRGMTSYEAWKVRSKYGEKTVLENFHTVFGPLRWFPLQMLCPFRIDQKGDGAVFSVCREKFL